MMGEEHCVPQEIVGQVEQRSVDDFNQARKMRYSRYGARPWGLFGLFAHLADLRLDIEFARDAAWRRHRGLPHVAWIDFERAHRGRLGNKVCVQNESSSSVIPTTTNIPPLFTYLIMLLSTVMLVISIALNNWKIEDLRVNPMIGPSPEVLVRLGALQSARIKENDEWYRVFAPIILHAGLIHYGINMLAMWLIGVGFERVHGSIITALVFVTSAVGGNLASATFMTQIISVGASGGIFGLMGACLADISINWRCLTAKNSVADRIFPYGQVICWLSLDIFINTIIGFTPYLDNFCHLGGMFCGFCCGLVMLQRISASGFFGPMTANRKTRILLSRFLGLGLTGILFTSTTAWLANANPSTPAPCPGCRYITCAPFPFWSDDKWWYCDQCDFVQATLYQSNVNSWVELTCPNTGVAVNVDLQTTIPDPVSIRKQLSSFCRDACLS